MRFVIWPAIISVFLIMVLTTHQIIVFASVLGRAEGLPMRLSARSIHLLKVPASRP